MDINFLKREDISFKEKLKNIWVYYRYRILAVISIIVAIIVWAVSCSAQKSYDITVVVNVRTELSAYASEDLAEELQKICPDFNGDGEISVEVVDCSYDPANYTDENAIKQLQTLEARYFAQFGDKNKILYILSKDAIDSINSQSSYDTIVASELVPIAGTEIETVLCPDGVRRLDDCYAFCRAVVGSIKNERGVDEYYDQACEMLEIITETYKTE